MKRRSAIKGLSAIAIRISLFPSCGDGLHMDNNIPKGLKFSEQQGIWIEGISDAILPKDGLQLTTFEPFSQFVEKMVRFEKSDEDQKVFVRGYNNCTNDIKEMFQLNVNKVTPEQIVTYFEKVLNNTLEVTLGVPEEKERVAEKSVFCNELRSLSIQHLTTSKEYQEKILEYQLVPGFYNACVPV